MNNQDDYLIAWEETNPIPGVMDLLCCSVSNSGIRSTNIALVELAIIDQPEREFWIPAEFTLRCDADDSNAVVIDGGAYIDTRIATRNRCGGSGEILKRPPNDAYKSRWRGTTNLKFVVDCSPITSTQIMPIDGGTDLLLDVGTVNLITADGGAVCPPEP